MQELNLMMCDIVKNIDTTTLSMASGKRFVASTVWSIRDIVEDYSELFPHKNPLALSELILKILNDGLFSEEI